MTEWFQAVSITSLNMLKKMKYDEVCNFCVFAGNRKLYHVPKIAANDSREPSTSILDPWVALQASMIPVTSAMLLAKTVTAM